VTVGTVFERSKIKLNTWVHAVDLYTASKKGFSAHQLHRTLNVTYKTAWFMAHRIREAMSDQKGPSNPMGGAGKIVEADETYFGQKADKRKVTTSGRPYTKGGNSGPSNKIAIVSLVERGGKVRSFHVDRADANTVRDILFTNVTRDTALHTDESRLYTVTGRDYASHETVNHSAKEYARGIVHTNTIEGFFSIFKRGMKGVYQHCGEQHLHRYLAEFDFRYNQRTSLGFNDTSVSGKRLMYRRPDEAKVS
jgi:transposase-like protein